MNKLVPFVDFIRVKILGIFMYSYLHNLLQVFSFEYSFGFRIFVHRINCNSEIRTKYYYADSKYYCVKEVKQSLSFKYF